MKTASEKIRAAMAKNPKATNKDLAERFDVSATLVSHIRTAGKTKTVKATKVVKATNGKVVKPVKVVARKHDTTIDRVTLVAANALVKDAGGITAVREALDVLESLN